MAVKLLRNDITPSIDKIIKELDNLPKEAYDYWVKQTPKDTGNARSKTKLRGNTIRAEYDYAGALDQGRSKQAPKGMSKPTEDFIKKELDRKIRK